MKPSLITSVIVLLLIPLPLPDPHVGIDHTLRELGLSNTCFVSLSLQSPNRQKTMSLIFVSSSTQYGQQECHSCSSNKCALQVTPLWVPTFCQCFFLQHPESEASRIRCLSKDILQKSVAPIILQHRSQYPSVSHDYTIIKNLILTDISIWEQLFQN